MQGEKKKKKKPNLQKDEDKAWWLARKDQLTSKRTRVPTHLPAPTPI